MLRRWSRPLRHRATVLVIVSARAALRTLPASLVPPVGALVGRFIGLMARLTSREVDRRLQTTLVNPPRAGAVWGDLGRRAAEFLVADRLAENVHLAPGALDAYREASASGDGVLFATAHLGNWELMATALAALGFPIHAIAAQPQPGPLGRLLSEHRSRLGVHTLAPGSGARAAVGRLKQGGTVSIFVDQSTAERGRLIPFLGIDAHTPMTFERLLEASGATPMFIWNYRNEEGHYVINVERVPEEAPLTWVTARLETLVRAYPT